MEINTSVLAGKSHIHFIGIGGSGMFPLAQILHSEGYFISGSDNNPSDTVDLVKKMGVSVYMGQRKENIIGADLIIYTAAIMSDNEEFIAAQESGVLMLERSSLLGVLTRQYKNSICISGTHGKTTTTSMLTQILLDANLDPTAVIGGKLPSIGGNGRLGNSDIMVSEACEFVDTFLHLNSTTSVILNIDEDHMDYFKTMENLIASFTKFSEQTKKLIIANGDDKNVMSAVAGLDKPVLTFGFSPENDYYPENIIVHDGICTSFDLMHRSSDNSRQSICELEIFVPGRHNVLNAVAAALAAVNAGVDLSHVKKGFKNFKGVGRRFEVIGVKNGITVVDDYAHHPAEIKVTLEAAQSMNFKRIIAVHQPFTYTRTKLHLDYFADVLKLADKVVLSEIMGSREKNTLNIYAKDLSDKIEGAVWFDTFDEIAEHVCSIAQEGDLIITLGCGDVYKAARLILDGIGKDEN